MSSKKNSYSAKIDNDDMDNLGERLAADLRKSIRHLDNHPLLSDPWFEMAEIFGRVANISDVESKLPAAKDHATLWETEEQALRFILEDGKLNLCLRLLIDFKAKQIEARHHGRGPIMDFATECDKFEKGVGVVMRNAWQHVEVLQTTDIPALIHHISDVLDATLAMPEVIEPLLKLHDIHQRQEVLVFYYLNGLIRNIGDISELRIMPFIRERRIFIKAMSVLLSFGTAILTTHRVKAAEALSLLAQSEDFVTHPNQYYDTRNAREMNLMLDFREKVLTSLMTDFETRKALRPLADVIDRLRRQLSRK